MSSGGPKSWFESVSSENYNLLVEYLKTSENLSEAEATLGVNALFGSSLVCIFLIFLALLARKGLNAAKARNGMDKYLADPNLSIRNFFEMFVGTIFGLATDSLNKADSKKFFWLFGGLFIYIFSSNLIGVLPGGIPPTQSMSNNVAMATVVLLVFTVIGISRQGVGYFTHMGGPVWWLFPLIFVIEFFGAFLIRPFSLSIRLTGNITGDHLVLGIAGNLVEWCLPVVVLALGMFVSFIQALVFTLLTIVYVQLSMPHDDEHH